MCVRACVRACVCVCVCVCVSLVHILPYLQDQTPCSPCQLLPLSSDRISLLSSPGYDLPEGINIT